MKSPINNIPLVVTASVMAIAGFTQSAPAQSAALEEVIVTASKRAENLQDLPVTVTAFSSAVIEEAGIYSADDVAILTPSLTINTNLTPFDARMNIRGIGTAQRDPALEPSVGMFVDGMFFGRTGLGMADLTDIERIEVLQGPQGTLYGKNSNAGAISIVTKAPSQDNFEGTLEASRGNYGLDRYTGVLSGPITDRLAFRISGNMHQQNGFFHRPCAGVRPFTQYAALSPQGVRQRHHGANLRIVAVKVGTSDVDVGQCSTGLLNFVE